MTRIRQCLFALPLLLGGCTAYEWYQPGVTPEQVRADRSDCARAADREAFFAYGPPFFATPSWYLSPYCGWSCAHSRYQHDQFYYRFQRDNEVRRLTDFCMRSKGYALREIAPQSTP
jgi:hypothetical protein